MGSVQLMHSIRVEVFDLLSLSIRLCDAGLDAPPDTKASYLIAGYTSAFFFFQIHSHLIHGDSVYWCRIQNRNILMLVYDVWIKMRKLLFSVT